MMNIVKEGLRMKDKAPQVSDEEDGIKPYEFEYEDDFFSEAPNENPAEPDPDSIRDKPRNDPEDSNHPGGTPRFNLTKKWKFILLSQKFIDTYPKSKHTDNLKRLQEQCQQKIHTSAEFDRLVQQANRHGQDWRLPSPAEISDLYKKKPFFPSVSSQWYWTSKSIKRYFEQWIIDVEVIIPAEAGDLKQVQKESWECGTVRAVRGRKI